MCIRDRPEHVEAFRRHFPLDGRILVDPGLESYRAAGLRRGILLTLFRPASLAGGWRAWRRGFRQGRLQGDAWQQGGTLVLGSNGQVLLRHVSAGTGDYASNQAILAALLPSSALG